MLERASIYVGMLDIVRHPTPWISRPKRNAKHYNQVKRKALLEASKTQGIIAKRNARHYSQVKHKALLEARET